MIKQKNSLLQVTASTTELENLFVNYIKSLSSDESVRYKDARKRLELSRQISQAIKDNSSVQKEKQASIVAVEKESSNQENLTDLQAHQAQAKLSTSTSVFDYKEKLKLLLKEMEVNRKKNELVYGYKVGNLSQTDNKQWGLEACETKSYYKKNLDSTITREKHGWTEFGITYDNKFFINYPITDDIESRQFDFNHLTMSCGTFLKAAGKIKIEKENLIISPYSQHLDLGPRYLPIILFVLRAKGVVLLDENCCIVNEDDLPISGIRFETSSVPLNSVAYYLDEKLFPLAKSIAEDENLSIELRLSNLFLAIDDEVLNTQNPVLIKNINNKKTELKSDIIDFLLTITNISLNNESLQKNESNTLPVAISENQDSFSEKNVYHCYSQLLSSLQIFHTEHQLNLSFIKNELSTWFYYILSLSFKAESEIEDEKNDSVMMLQKIEKALLRIKEVPTLLPERSVNIDKSTVSFLQFYKEDPIKTCIALLRDYTKGSFWGRFFNGAWNRHHVNSVEQFLKKYQANYFADNLSIQDIYRELFKVHSTLLEFSGKRGTLFARLQFCAELANELESKTLAQDFSTCRVEFNEGNVGLTDRMVDSETKTNCTSETANVPIIGMPSSSAITQDPEVVAPSPRGRRKTVVFSSTNDEPTIETSDSTDCQVSSSFGY